MESCFSKSFEIKYLRNIEEGLVDKIYFSGRNQLTNLPLERRKGKKTGKGEMEAIKKKSNHQTIGAEGLKDILSSLNELSLSLARVVGGRKTPVCCRLVSKDCYIKYRKDHKSSYCQRI